MTKQEAWEAWARPIAGHLVTSLADSSHGKAFSAGWDAAKKEAVDYCENSPYPDGTDLSLELEKEL